MYITVYIHTYVYVYIYICTSIHLDIFTYTYQRFRFLVFQCVGVEGMTVESRAMKHHRRAEFSGLLALSLLAFPVPKKPNMVYLRNIYLKTY